MINVCQWKLLSLFILLIVLFNLVVIIIVSDDFFFSKWFFLHWKFQQSIKCVIQPVYWFIDPVCYFNDILELEVIYPDLKIYNCLIPNRWQSAVVAPNNRISNLLFEEKVPRLLNSNIIMFGVTAPQKLWLRAYTICGGHSIAQEICNY